jgi:murein DD-endopeptidase MepM/ murein hydrolase activator NlpD
MRLRAIVLSVSVLAAGGFVRADHHLRRRSTEPVRTPDVAAQALSSLEQDERALRAELDSVAGKETAVKKRMLARGRTMYRLVRVGLLPVGGGFGSLLDHAIKMERVRRALDDDMAEFRGLGDRKIALARKLDDLATRRAPLELEREAAAKARALLGEAEDRRRAFERAFETSTGAGDYVAVYGGGLGGPLGPEPAGPEGFRGMKGRLPFPIAGRAEVRTVRRSGASGPGLEMLAPVGTPVRAVYSGRVAFADRYDPFGQIVILDHGDHYYTLMGDLAAIEVKVGDDLSAGAKVGTVGRRSGEDSAKAASALYFEVRQGANTIEPGPWLGLGP